MRQTTLQRHISRLMAVLLCALLLLPCLPTARADEKSGTCGDNLSWSLDAGTLTITGSGAMTNFPESSMAPWYSSRGEIRQISLPDGLTHIGDLAFYDCYRLTAVYLPDSVTSIGEFAFASSEKLELLDLGDGLQTISRDAFHGCWALRDLRLPQSLRSIGNQAFYDCSSITGVVIPANVSNMGSACFAYCTSLVRAEIQTQLVKLPEWTFFGCTQLSTLILPNSITEMGNAALRECTSLNVVSYGGDSMTTDQLKDAVANDVPGFGSTGNVTNENPGQSSSSGTAIENENGTVTEKITTVTSGEQSNVTVTVDRTFQEDDNDTVNAQIHVTIESEDGWDEALESVQTGIQDAENREQYGATVGTANIVVHVKDSDTVSEKFVEQLTGQNAVITVITKDGSSWKIDCREMTEESASGTYDLRYTVEPADEQALSLMGVTEGYQIRFEQNVQQNAEVMIRLPDTAIRQTATFFRLEKADTLTRFQSVIVDAEGCAHLDLGSVDKKSTYYLGINVPDAKLEAIIPEELYNEYRYMDHSTGKEYVITGRSSSWNMGLGKVMAILAVVMVSAVGVIGFVMYFWNKQRLQNGYVPKWEDDEEE